MIAQLLIACLIVWRITSLLVAETGPFGILARSRDWIGVGYDEVSQCRGNNVIAEMLCCFRCTSVWVALPLAVLWFRDEWLAYTLAISAGAIMMERIIDG